MKRLALMEYCEKTTAIFLCYVPDSEVSGSMKLSFMKNNPGILKVVSEQTNAH